MKIFISLLLFISFLNSSNLLRFKNVENYKVLTTNEKRHYLMGSVDMLSVQLKNRYSMNNKISLCLNSVNKSSDLEKIFETYLLKVGNKYDNYSTSEIFTLAIVDFCKK